MLNLSIWIFHCLLTYSKCQLIAGKDSFLEFDSGGFLYFFFFVARALKSAASSQRTVEQLFYELSVVRALQGVVME